MTPPPILNYAPAPQMRLLRKATSVMLRTLGCFYSLYAVLSVVAVFSSHHLSDWLLLLLSVPTSIVFLGINLTADRVARRWAVTALITVLINLGAALSCVGSALLAKPQEAPDGLVRDFALYALIPFQIVLVALAVMLILILRQLGMRAPKS